MPEEPSSKEEEKNDNKNLAAPDDIFSAKKKLGEWSISLAKIM